MPKRIALIQIHVMRDNKRQVVKPEQLFDFTDDEIKDLKANDKLTGFESFRLPINEGGTDPAANAKAAKRGAADAASEDL